MFLVLQRQTDLIVARSREARAKADMAEAKANLDGRRARRSRRRGSTSRSNAGGAGRDARAKLQECPTAPCTKSSRKPPASTATLPALRQPGGAGTLTYSWNQYKQAADEIAAGLRALGIGKGDVVALNSETRLEFYLADLGIITNGSIAAAMYPSYPPADLVKTLAASQARARFRGGSRRRSVAARRSRRPLDPADRRGRRRALARRAAPARPRRDRARPAAAARLRSEVQPSDPAILYLTSGATGEPKMALVTHRAIVSNIDMGPAVLPLGPEDSTVAFLPSAHIAQRVVIEFLPLRSRHAGHLLRRASSSCRRTSARCGPPSCSRRRACGSASTRPSAPSCGSARPPARKAFYGALGLALAAARYRREGKPVPLRIRAPLTLADRLLFTKDPRALRRTPEGRRLRRGAAQQGPRGVLRGGRHAADRRLRPDRGRRASV